MRVKLLIDNPRLNEMAGVLVLLLAIGVLLCLVSYSPGDPSANVSTSQGRATNWMGLPGSFGADLILQSFGLAGFLIPVWLGFVALQRIRNVSTAHMRRRTGGGALLTLVLCSSLQLVSLPVEAVMPSRWESTVRAGGALGKVLTDGSTSVLNIGGTILLLLACASVGGYMLTSLRVADIFGRRGNAPAPDPPPTSEDGSDSEGEATVVPVASRTVGTLDALPVPAAAGRSSRDEPPQEDTSGVGTAPPVVPYRGTAGDPTIGGTLAGSIERGVDTPAQGKAFDAQPGKPQFQLPATSLLNPPYAKEPYVEAQLQETAQQIVEKFEDSACAARSTRSTRVRS